MQWCFPFHPLSYQTSDKFNGSQGTKQEVNFAFIWTKILSWAKSIQISTNNIPLKLSEYVSLKQFKIILERFRIIINDEIRQI